MLDFKKVLLFLGLSIGLFAALYWIVPNSGLDKWYSKQYTKIGNKLYGDYKGKAKVEIKEEEKGKIILTKIMSKSQIAKATADARRKRQTAIQVNHAQFQNNLWLEAWIPMMLILSLILATPIPFKRRLLSLLLGLAAVTIFIAFKYWVRFVVDINRHGWLEMGTQGDFMKNIFVQINTYLGFTGPSLFVILLLWALVTFRKGDQIYFMKPTEVE